MSTFMLLSGVIVGCSAPAAAPAPVTSGESVVIEPAHHGDIKALAFSPDGAWLAASIPSQGVQVWAIATGELIHTLPGSSATVVWGTTSNYVISGDEDAVIRVWHVSSETANTKLTGHKVVQSALADGGVGRGIHALALSKDGTELASSAHDTTVRLWDMDTYQQEHVLNDFPASVVALAYSPDGTLLATGGWDQPVILWDVTTGTQRLRLAAEPDSTYSVAFSPDGRWLATGGKDQNLRMWDTTSGTLRMALDQQQWVYCVTFSQDGTNLAAGGQDGLVRLWDSASGELLRTFAGHTAPVYSVAFAPDGRTLATAGKDGTIRLWDVASVNTIEVLEPFRSRDAP